MDFTKLKETVDRCVEKFYPGIDLCVHHKGERVFRYSAGTTDGVTPLKQNAFYYIFSCSKPLTCTAALQFFEKGYYRLNDPVYDFIPEFKDVVVKKHLSNGIIQYVKPDSPITIGQLFSMTSGINYDLDMPSILEVGEKSNGAMPTLDVVKAIAKNPLEFQPGTSYLYGLNHDVLGGLIEVWSGMKFGDYIKKNLFEPLGMKNTGFKVTDEIKARVPKIQKYDAQTGETRFETAACRYMLGEQSEYESGGAGVVSCVDDYIEFADAMCHGGVSPKTGERILSRRTIDLMRVNQLDDEMLPCFAKSMHGYGYGLGVRTLVTNARGVLSNIGEFGWDGAAGCFCLIDTKEQLAVFMGANRIPSFNSVVPVLITNTLYSML